MKIRKSMILTVLLVFIMLLFTGCWNYREVEDLAIIGGVAIDKNADGTVHMTVEIVDIAADGQVNYEPVYIEIDGNTFFEAARKVITVDGKRLYWSHAKIVIVSEEIAREDITRYIDFLFRDAEAREDLWLLVSAENTAGEIFKSKGMLKPIVSFQIDDSIRSAKIVSRFPNVEFFEFLDRLFYKYVSPVLPTVKLIEEQGGKTPQVSGAAVFKGKKMVGALSEEQVKYAQILRNELEGGLIILKDVAGSKTDATFEIFKSKTKMTPFIQEDMLKMELEIDLEANIGELIGNTDFITPPGDERLKEAAQKAIEENIQNTFQYVRDTYGADIYGFGRQVEISMPELWNQIKTDWDEVFKELELEVSVHLRIRGSATTRTILK